LLKAWLDFVGFNNSNSIKPHSQRDLTPLSFYFYLQLLYFNLAVVTLLLTLGKVSTAQSLTGVWKGTSLCQVKNSPCHDESVVYHISKGSRSDSYQISASKIIDGKENDMGTLNFTFDPHQKILFLIDTLKQVKWEI
jgi:hypothetical protein